MNDSWSRDSSLLHRIFSHRVLVSIFIMILAATATYLWMLYREDVEPMNFSFEVRENDTVQMIGKNLVETGVIRHPIFFNASYILFGEEKSIEPGGYALSNTMSMREIVSVLEERPLSKHVFIPENLDKERMGKLLASALDWSDIDEQFFSNTLAGMQWQHYQEYIREYFQDKYAWNDKKTQTFLTLSALYFEPTYDFMKRMYSSGSYEIPVNASRADVAGMIIDQFVKDNPNDREALTKYVDKNTEQNIIKMIAEEMILLPDIVSLPPLDVKLKTEKDKTSLLFTTSYWNKGRGPLELLADPNTKDTAGDIERKVYQRIYNLDGNYTERVSGTFLWHSPHLHFHFKDFAVYTLEPMDTALESDGEPDIMSHKSTFCVRDSEPIDLAHPAATREPAYRICGRQRQGISPGWADSYYYSYVDQKFDVSKLSKGTYKLKITINPLDRFDEITKDNNIGEAIIDLDVANKKVKVISAKTYGI